MVMAHAITAQTLSHQHDAQIETLVPPASLRYDHASRV
jgi:hypothetical protein